MEKKIRWGESDYGRVIIRKLISNNIQPRKVPLAITSEE